MTHGAINSKDYNLIRILFDLLESPTFSTADIDTYVQRYSFFSKYKNINIVKEIIKKIQLYFMNITNNASCNEGKPCNYINYRINDQDKLIHSNERKDFFLDLKKYIESNIISSSDNIYTSEIKYIENDEFQKIQELYDIYNNISFILQVFSKTNKSESFYCNELEVFIKNYKHIISTVNENIHLLNVLNNLKCSIKSNVWFSNNNCNPNILRIFNNDDNSNNKIECNEWGEKEYIKPYSEDNYASFSRHITNASVNMKIIIAISFISVFLLIKKLFTNSLTKNEKYKYKYKRRNLPT
ncbi:variable surface protein [Plasmodium gonderi]|uniref:Variable surface protein n=1 Tax=Plasmodium gonderi TaxID=77519 RepID=A0A1Y1JU70_PLAGO|nr:variable surface protein [Plasmodium gonderi]GAW84657.1 variable surface protein [Plasmodium gonderi]